jgi:hypothetical protein
MPTMLQGLGAREPWHALLAPLPADSPVERKPVASPEQLAAGTADAIAGWESLSVLLSDPPRGLRHVLVTVDGDGTLLCAADWVLVSRAEVRDGVAMTLHDHHNIGGRFEADGSFHGTMWRSRSEVKDGEDCEAATIASTPSAPSDSDIEALRRLVAEVMRRAPERS